MTSQIENCQGAVHHAYTTSGAHALVDHRLYLPSSWTHDQDRLRAAGVPEQGWQKRSVGAGAKGERSYDWALIDDRCNEHGVR